MLGHLGRFIDSACRPWTRGDRVLVESWRGREWGEILAESTDSSLSFAGSILAALNPDDERSADLAWNRRSEYLTELDSIFQGGHWPIEVVDAELTLDHRLIVHFLGSHGYATAGLVALLGDRLDLDIIFQPIGPDQPTELESADPSGCGTGGCGSCGVPSETTTGTSRGCGSSKTGGGGCAGCAVESLVLSRSESALGRDSET